MDQLSSIPSSAARDTRLSLLLLSCSPSTAALRLLPILCTPRIVCLASRPPPPLPLHYSPEFSTAKMDHCLLLSDSDQMDHWKEPPCRLPSTSSKDDALVPLRFCSTESRWWCCTVLYLYVCRWDRKPLKNRETVGLPLLGRLAEAMLLTHALMGFGKDPKPTQPPPPSQSSQH
jgi:hypothetical protein